MTFATKLEARSASTTSRNQRDMESLAQASSGLIRHDWESLVRRGNITCYVSMDTEPPTEELRHHLMTLERIPYLPIMKPARQLAWGRDGDALNRNAYGVLEPEEDSTFALSSSTAMIIPALRCGTDGTRLGRGAGYYDRALATLPPHSVGGPLRIVVVFDDEVDETVPHDELDQHIDVIVTPLRIIRLSE
jgi:5-formyltetrahydrofolate cyclo-ligase